jgi:hypothetical protein
MTIFLHWLSWLGRLGCGQQAGRPLTYHTYIFKDTYRIRLSIRLTRYLSSIEIACFDVEGGLLSHRYIKLFTAKQATVGALALHALQTGDNQTHRSTNASRTAVTIILYGIIGAISLASWTLNYSNAPSIHICNGSYGDWVLS